MARKIDELKHAAHLVQAATLFYIEKKSKSEISHLLKVSATQVARLIDEAEKQGIVKIEVAAKSLENLSNKLRDRFKCLREVIVVPTVTDFTFQQDIYGKAAAEYFENNVKPGNKIAIGGGSTLFEMIRYLPEERREISIYPTAMIGRGPTISHIDPIVNVTLLWVKSGRANGMLHYCTVLPFEKKNTIAEIKREKDNFLKREKVKEVFRAMLEVDVVFSSVGSIAPEDMMEPLRQPNQRIEALRTLRASKPEFLGEQPTIENKLKQEGVVGEINYTFFDKDGITKADWNLFVIGLGVDELQKMAKNQDRRVIVIAGTRKEEPLRVVLKTGLCNTLITDAQTAKWLLAD
jgi:DNA-binding transcriptional regulator LsrR (DeoR family)